MQYPIELDIPIPPTRYASVRAGRPREPVRLFLESMPVGGSFLTPHFEEYRKAANTLTHLFPRCYTTRKIAGEGWRIWRVA